MLLAIDLAPRSLSILRSRAVIDILPVQADMVLPPLRLQAFDGVLMCSSLHWARDPVLAIRRACAALKPGGLFTFSIFAAGNLQILADLQDSRRIRVPVQYLTQDSLLRLIDDAGLEMLSLSESIEEQLFPDALSALRSISGIGAGVTANHLSVAELRSFIADYDALARRGGSVVNEYRALVGVARVPIEVPG